MTERKESHGLWFPNTFTFIQTYQNLFKKYSEGRAEGNAIFSISCQRHFPCLGKKHWLTITHRRIQFYAVTKSLIGKIFLISNLLLFNMRVLFFRHMELKKLQSTNEVLTCLDHVKLYSVNSINYQTIDNLIYDHMCAVKRQSLIILALNNWFLCIFVWTSTTKIDQCRWSNDQFFFKLIKGRGCFIICENIRMPTVDVGLFLQICCWCLISKQDHFETGRGIKLCAFPNGSWHLESFF